MNVITHDPERSGAVRDSALSDGHTWIITDALIVGGGPAGLSPLVAASKAGLLDALLARGIVVVERAATIGGGRIGDYVINSDSAAEAFLSCVEGDADPRFAALARHPATMAVNAHRGGAVPLPLIGAFLALIGKTLDAIIAEQPRSKVLCGWEVVQSRQVQGGLWLSSLRRLADDVEASCVSRCVVIATGGYQSPQRLLSERVAGEPLLPRYQGRLMQSGEVLTEQGLGNVTAALIGRPKPRIAIVGGSTSAVAVAHAFLHRMPGVAFDPGAITILHRRPLRIFYPSAQAALAEGYDEFGTEDICPLSGFVFRLAGFRLDSRDLVMRLRGIAGRPAEPRVVCRVLEASEDAASRAILDQADLVIACLGYQPQALPLLDEAGEPIPLAADIARQPLVDGFCRVIDAQRQPIAGLYGIGLAAGFVPHGRLGGEPSFSGQANGLWLWQNDVGALIAESLLADAPVSAASDLMPSFASA